MPNLIRIRRRTSGAPGAPAGLQNAELAFNEVDNVLYYGQGTGGSGGSATTILAIGGSGAMLNLSGAQTITGVKTVTGGSILAAGAVSVTVPTMGGTDNSTAAANTAWVSTYAQPVATMLTALVGLATNGSITRTGAGTVAARSLAGPAAGLSITNADGVAGNPTIALTNDLSAVEALGGTGVAVRIATDTWAVRTLTSTGGRLTITNGDGVANNPNLDLTALAIGGSGVGTFTRLTVDTYGRVTSTAQANLNDLSAATADFSHGGFKITNLADPINPTDAATKQYVDGVATGLDVKGSVRVAASTNITITAPGATIDGVAMAAGDRVLLRGQTTGSQNGLYVWNGAAATMTRTTDADANAEVTPGMFVFVEDGATDADKGFVLTTNAPIVVGTTALAFALFSSTGQALGAGQGLAVNGSVLDVQVSAPNGTAIVSNTIQLTGQALALHTLATSGIIVRTGVGTVTSRSLTGTANRVTVTNGDGVAGNPTLDIAATYVGQSTITTLGTITTGVWTGTAIAVANGGTGGTTQVTARTGLGLGDMAVQNASAVVITGGTIDNITLDGGTY